MWGPRINVMLGKVITERLLLLDVQRKELQGLSIRGKKRGKWQMYLHPSDQDWGQNWVRAVVMMPGRQEKRNVDQWQYKRSGWRQGWEWKNEKDKQVAKECWIGRVGCGGGPSIIKRENSVRYYGLTYRNYISMDLVKFFLFYLIWSFQTSNHEEIPYENSLISHLLPFLKHVFALWWTLFY